MCENLGTKQSLHYFALLSTEDGILNSKLLHYCKYLSLEAVKLMRTFLSTCRFFLGFFTPWEKSLPR